MKHDSTTSTQVQAEAVLVPHAGWKYSGRLAAQTLKRVKIPHWAIIFAPQHRGGGAEWAVAPHQTWLLPGKNIEANLPLTEKMIQAVDFFAFDPVPHAQEHAVEILLPILARLAPETKITALAMSQSSWEMIRQGAAQFLRESPSEGRSRHQLPVFGISGFYIAGKHKSRAMRPARRK